MLYVASLEIRGSGLFSLLGLGKRKERLDLVGTVDPEKPPLSYEFKQSTVALFVDDSGNLHIKLQKGSPVTVNFAAEPESLLPKGVARLDNYDPEISTGRRRVFVKPGRNDPQRITLTALGFQPSLLTPEEVARTKMPLTAYLSL